MKEFIEVKIDNAIKVQANIDGKNDFVNIDKIYLKCFNKKDHQNITLLMRNQYKRMMIENANLFSDLIKKEQKIEIVNKNTDDEINSIIEILSICDGNNLVSFYDKFKEFLLKQIAFKDQSLSQPINSIDLNNLEIQDFEKIVASYIVVFFVASWMKQM